MDPPIWSNVVRSSLRPATEDHPPLQPIKETQRASEMSFRSTIGISTVVIDANSVIDGAEKLNGIANRFVTVPEVLSEIRDPMSRHRLALIPFTIEPKEPSPESLSKVVKFARATGDLQTLSDVDLKLLALTYTLEVQAHGSAHLRDAPPSVKTVNVKRLPENKMPGWGCNDSSSGWEALEKEGSFEEENAQVSSRILPMKYVNLDVTESGADCNDKEAGNGSTVMEEEPVDDGVHYKTVGNRIFPSKKREVNLEGKVVAEGVDASMGQYGDNVDEWSPAVNRSTRRRFLRRKAKFEYFQSLSEDCDQTVNSDHVNDDGASAVDNVENEISDALERIVIEEVHLSNDQDENFEDPNVSDIAETVRENQALEHFDVSSQTNDNCGASVGNGNEDTDDRSSQTSWILRSLSDSSVACVTNDFAMQNVLVQMGLRLLSSGGNTIRQLHRWVLKCHACFTITAEIGRIFCPKCGNGGTLRKVAVTVGENGIVLTSRTPRIILRGTKFSLPHPQGGRDAISKNPILREDQLPQKYLHPRKTKKKVSKQGDDFFAIDNFFNPHAEKNGPFRPNMRKTVAVYSGRRNPNDNHYSVRKH